jgi:hypothetical protein
MGKNKRYRLRLEGQRRALDQHLAKIEIERRKPKPNLARIAVWEKTIENIRNQIEKLERRLKE